MAKSDPRRFLDYLAAERNASLLYRALADTVEGDRREALLELADIEDKHAEHWAAKLVEHGIDAPSPPASLDPNDAELLNRARALGIDGILETLEQTEAAAEGMYDDEPDALPTMPRRSGRCVRINPRQSSPRGGLSGRAPARPGIGSTAPGRRAPPSSA